MWRAGVTTLRAARARPLADTETRRYALAILEELETAYRPDDEPLVARLYDEVVVGGNVYKTTRAGRFADLDRKILETAAGRFPDAATFVVEDAGASNGITSLELHELLRSERPVALEATDWFDAVLLVRPGGSAWTAVLDPEGRAIQYAGARFVLSAACGESRRHPLNRWLLARLERRLLGEARALVERGAGAPELRRLTLWHPRCKLHAAKDPSFTLARRDVFAPAPRRHHLIRAMNVLNPGYFPKDRLRAAFRALAESLVPGGVLIAGRTFEERGGVTHATAWELAPGGFRELWRCGEGYEAPELA